MQNLKPIPAVSKAGLQLCLAGSRKVLINGQLYHVRRGTLCIISPIVSQLEISRDEEYRELLMLDDMDIFFQVVKQAYDTVLSIRLRENSCMQLSEEQIRFLIERKEQVDVRRRQLEASTNKEELRLLQLILRFLQQETMLEVIHLYYLNSPITPEPMEKYEGIAMRFLYSLNMNYRTHRTVFFYANEANLSTSYFTRIIKERTGRPPSEWIISVTILNAKLFLSHTEKSIKEVAEELNFPEQFTFRKFFKQHVGVPPKEFRMQSRRERIQ